MKLLLQRVREACVEVEGETVGRIGRGLLLFAGITSDDDHRSVARLAERVLRYRVFADAGGRMNLSVTDVAGDLLVVSQFTLAADTGRGLRPSFSGAAPPEKARELFECFLTCLGESGLNLACGRFAADMQVSLVNDGPVTFLLE